MAQYQNWNRKPPFKIGAESNRGGIKAAVSLAILTEIIASKKTFYILHREAAQCAEKSDASFRVQFYPSAFSPWGARHPILSDVFNGCVHEYSGASE
ncbi:hypothetical protein [Tropicimonas aquimaris]|uniref:Uncharacterized protein n=1 Tax=Tropicimonas aquimaris TaxID=914152 RepID=A0ABW3IZ22_9RHOB